MRTPLLDFALGFVVCLLFVTLVMETPAPWLAMQPKPGQIERPDPPPGFDPLKPYIGPPRFRARSE